MGETPMPQQDVQSNEELARAAAGGSRENFALLYSRFYSRTFRLAYGMTADRELAEDLTQEIFLRAFRKLDHFHFQSSFATWFYRLALNHCLNYRQRRLSKEMPILETDSPVKNALEDEILKEQIQGQVHRALLTLKPKLRLILILKDLEELSYAEVAERLEISPGTVASRLNRARQQLAFKLQHLRGMV